MARIVINTVGSTGDLLPFVALGKGLQARGHSVVFAVNAAMHKTIEAAGLETRPCGPEMSDDVARQNADMFDGSDPRRQLRKLVNEFLFPGIPPSYRDLTEACRGADLLIAATIQFAAPMVCEKLGIAWHTVSLSPSQFSSAGESPPQWPQFLDSPLTNRLAWSIVLRILRKEFLPGLNRIRAELGFGALKGAPMLEDFSPELILLASSRHFSDPQPDWPSQLKMTGYWFYDGKEQASWKPPDALAEFVSHGEKPIVLSLGSMVQKDPEGVAALHSEAATRLKRRLVIQQGWAKMGTDHLKPYVDRGQVIGAGFVPHDWLFSHADAVIHHGGAGTTARALRHGCAMLVEPHGFDQPYNARRVRELGVGDSVASHRRSLPRVERALRNVLAEKTRSAAARIGEAVRREDGVAEACRLIEEKLRLPVAI